LDSVKGGPTWTVKYMLL